MNEDDLDRLEAIERRLALLNAELDAFALEGAEITRLVSAGQMSTARLRAFHERNDYLQAQISNVLDELDQIGRNA